MKPNEMTVPELEAELAKLVSQLTPTPDKNCGNIVADLDGEEVIVEYEYEAGQDAQTSGPPDRCWEGIAPSVSIGAVWIRGACIDAGNFQQSLLDKWEQAAIDAEQDAKQAQYEDYQSSKEY